MFKSRKVIVVSLVGIICLTILMFAIPFQPSIHLNCIYTTNKVVTVLLRPGETYKTNMVFGMFRLENKSAKRIIAPLGFFQNEHEHGVEAQVGDYIAPILSAGRDGRLPRGISTFEASIPPHDGKYRLVVKCEPSSNRTASYMTSFRFRLARFLSHLTVTNSLVARLFGTEYVFSQWIPGTPPNTALEPTATAP
jgi:hypothetical protein